MIKSITIENFRGIPSLTLDELTPLVVLVGPNGCGKSTVLDAMLIGASGSPGDAVGRAVKRRVELWGGARWLFPRGGHAEARPTIAVTLDPAAQRKTTLRLMDDVSPENEQKLLEKRLPEPSQEVLVNVESDGRTLTARTAFSHRDNEYVFSWTGPRELRGVSRVHFIEPKPGARHASLTDAFMNVVEEGRLDELRALVSEVVPGLTNLMSLSDRAGGSVLHLVFHDGSVPVAIAGDGIATLVRLACDLSLPGGATALIEEPEVHQHPRSERQTARAIVAAVRRGVQVVLSTHSLELIDDLLDALEESEVPLLTVFGMAKRKGEIFHSRYEGQDVAFARERMGEDLR